MRKRERGVISSLVGLNRNRVEVAQGELAPAHLVNLSNVREGGLSPLGSWNGHGLSRLSGADELVGFDSSGLVSWRNSGSGELGVSVISGSSSGVVGGSASSSGGAHVPGTGVYKNVDEFLVRDRDGNAVTPGVVGFDFSVSGGFVGDPTAPVVVNGVPSGFEVLGAVFDAGFRRWVIIGVAGGVVRSAWRDDDGGSWTWSTIGGVSVGGFDSFRDVVSCPGVIVFALKSGVVVRSTDGGETWSSSNFISDQGGSTSNYILTSIVASAENSYIGISLYRTGGSGSTGGLYVSRDGGGTYSLATSGMHNIVALTMMIGSVRDDDPTGQEWYFGVHRHSPEPYLRAGARMFSAYVRASDFKLANTSGWRYSMTADRDKQVPRFGIIKMFGNASTGAIPFEGVQVSNGGDRSKSFGSWYYGDGVWLPGTHSVEVFPDKPPAQLPLDYHVSGDSLVGGGVLCDSLGAAFLTQSGSGALAPIPYAGGTVSWRAAAGNYYGDDFLLVGFNSSGELVSLLSSSPEADDSPGLYKVIAIGSVMTSAGKLVVHHGSGRAYVQGGQSLGVSVEPFSPEPDWIDNYVVEVFGNFSTLRDGVPVSTGAGYTRVAVLGKDNLSAQIVRPGVGEQVGTSGALAIAGFRDSGVSISGNEFPGLSVASHGGRTWFRASSEADDYVNILGEVDHRAMGGSKAVSFSVQGYVNLVELNSYLTLNASTQSDGVTGLLPSPSGLVAFCDNETFVVSGDPALGNMSSTLYPDLVGLDRGARPDIVGGVPFTVWKGRVWALQGSRVADVSAAVWLRDDPVGLVVSDPHSRLLFVLTEKRRVFAVSVDDGFWCEVPLMTEQRPLLSPGFTSRVLFPSLFGVLSYDSVRDGSMIMAVSPSDVNGGNFDVQYPEMAFLGFDGGDPLRRDNFLKVSMRTEAIGWNDGVGVPVLYFSARNASDPSVFDRSSSRRVVGRLHRDEWVFRFPAGLKGRKLDFLIDFVGMPFDAVIEPFIEVEFVPGSSFDRGFD